MTVIGHPLHSASRPTTARELRKPQTKKIVTDPLEDRLWSYYDKIEGLGNYVSILSNAADLVTYFPATEDQEPDESAGVLEVWEELGGETWLSTWVAELVRHMSVAGQAWLVPTTRERLAPPDESLSDVKWEVWSTLEVRRGLGLDPIEKIPDDKRLWRVWMSHPQDYRRADSPVRRVADKCEVLVLLDQRRIADSRTRLFAGVWPLPSRLRDEKTPSGKLWADALEEALIEPIHAPDSAASVVPFMVYVEAEDETILRGGPIALSIDDPARIDEMEEKILRRIAIGIDAPQELILGMEGLSHWQAWLIEKSTYTQHLDPLIVRILRSLTPWWKEQLGLRGVDSSSILWRNESSALAVPNRMETALSLHERYVISDARLRADADYPDEDAPSDEEIERRIRIAQASRARVESVPLEVQLDNSGVPASENPAAIRAQTGLGLDQLSRRLASIDQEVFIRAEREAARQMRRARRSIIDRLAKAAKAEGIEVGDPDTLPERLGPTEVTRLIGDPEADFDGAPFLALFLTAQDSTAETTARVGADRNRQADEDDRNTAAGFLVAALAAATLRYLYRRPDSRGEQGIDGAELVPTADLRKALDTAGGGIARRDGTRDAWLLIANGKRTVSDLQSVGIVTEGFRWVYGTVPRTPFPPHRDLDGVFFERWDDDVLRQTSETWVGGDHWFPSDHSGCRCTVERVLVEFSDAA